MTRALSVLAVAGATLLGGCQLIVGFDRDRIDASTDGDVSMDGGTDGGGGDAGVCGNSTVEVGEDCDDGRDGDDTDGCRDDCEYTCTLPADCTDNAECNGAEVCDLSDHTCGAGSAPSDGATCDDGGGTVCFGGNCIT